MRNSRLLRRLRRDRLILPFYFPALIVAFSQGLLIPVLPLYAKDFGVSYGLIGLLLAAQSIGMLVGDVPGGILLQWMGQKRTMLLGLGLTALTTVALFRARSVPEAFVYRFIAGFGGALYGVARHAYIAGAISTGNRGRAIALFGGIFRIGRFLGPLVGGMLAAAYGLRMPFVICGLGCGVALGVIWTFVPKFEVGVTPERASLRALLKSQVALLIPAGAGQIFAQMIRAGRSTIIPLYAADVIGLDVGAIGLMTTIAAGLEMTLFYPAGWIMDNLGRKWAIVPSFGLQALALACIPLTHSFAGLLLCAIGVGVANGLSAGAMMTLGADLAPPEVRGAFLGVWRLIGDVGSTGGPMVVGGVADLVQLPTAALALAGAGVLAAGIFGFLVPETLEARCWKLDAGS